MSDFEDYYSNRNSAMRVLLQSLDDKGKQQYAKIDGMTGETFERVMRIQPHGLSSHPPAGSHAFGIPMGHHRDMLAIFGGELPDKREKNIGEGNTVLYNADGTKMKLVGKDSKEEVPGEKIVEAKGKIVLKVGSSSITIEDGKITLKAEKIFGIGKTAMGVDSEDFPVKVMTESGPADKLYSKV